jgi:hypothetical protein
MAKEFSETTANTVVLCAKLVHKLSILFFIQLCNWSWFRRANAEKIFSAAAGFTGTGRMWIVNEASSTAKNIPTGFLSIRLRQSLSSALRDALVVARDGMEYLANVQKRAELENRTVPMPPSQCAGTSITDEWTNKVGNRFYKYVLCL